MAKTLAGFRKLDLAKKVDLIVANSNLTHDDVNAWKKPLDPDLGERLIENYVGNFCIPQGIAMYFIINDKGYLIPMVTEESSVIAAASNGAKRCQKNGGFVTNVDPPVMIGQIQMLDVLNLEKAKTNILEQKRTIIEACNRCSKTVVKLGGGCKDIKLRVVDAGTEKFLVCHLHVDCKDAMGANLVNTMAETAAPLLEKLSQGKALLRVLSNLCTERIARAKAVFSPEELCFKNSTSPRTDGIQIAEEIVRANQFACSDPYRACTHNKGIMNGISAVALACGQDTRAIEACAHAFASLQGSYKPLTLYKLDENKNLVGSIAVPLAVGIVGGITNIHPQARSNLKLLNVSSSSELAGVLASVGLAQNVAALRVLVSEGIQAGHMKMHASNLGISLGATNEEMDLILHTLENSKEKATPSKIKEMLDKIRTKL